MRGKFLDTFTRIHLGRRGACDLFRGPPLRGDASEGREIASSALVRGYFSGICDLLSMAVEIVIGGF